MIDWMELFMYNRFDYDVQHFVGHGNDGYYKPRADNRHEKIERWIANRINRRLAGYEAMKEELIGRSTWNDRDSWVMGNRDCAIEALSICQDAEKDYK
jgi:hypothetical protein